MENANAYLVLQGHVAKSSVKRAIGDRIATNHVSAIAVTSYVIQRMDVFVDQDIKVEPLRRN